MLRIGIVGTRGMGKIRARTTLNRDDCTLVCIAGRTEETLKEQAREWGCEYVLGHEALYARDDVDAVVVSTPNTSHHPIAMAAIEHDKHVFIEYPMASSLQEVDELIVAAKAKGVKLQAGHSNRFEDAHLFFKKHLPDLGRPMVAVGLVAFGHMWKWAADDGIMGDYFSLANFHHIDQFVDLFGPAEWVSGTLTKEQDEEGMNVLVEGCTQIQFASGVVAWSHFGMGTAGQFRWATHAQCTNGSLMHDGDITVARRAGERDVSLETVAADDFKQEIDSKDVDFGGFVDAVLNDAPCSLPGELARHSLEICFASTRSAQTGQRMSISEPTVDVQVH